MIDIIIIGGGPAGLSAAIYACRAGYSVTVFEELVCGGQAATTPEIENYPAIDKISGLEFSQKLYEHAKQHGAEVNIEAVVSVNLTQKEKQVQTTKGIYSSKTIIIANGAKRKKLGVDGEERLSGSGVSYCATCDGAFFKGKPVAIVGGGNTALEDALFLSKLCSEVHMIHRRDSFRGDRSLTNAVLSNSKIIIHYNSTVSCINGETRVESINVTNLHNRENSSILVSGLFIAIGLEPQNQIFSQQTVDNCLTDRWGYILTDENCHTHIKGVFAAGDTRSKKVRQLITAANDGAIAAISAGEYINNLK